uniref:Amelogenin n=1 Tax=Panagrolaimus sp. PS1159 TaxID=55785 RepID=A0AC35FHK0_9BILA
PPNNNQPQQYIVASNVGMQPHGSVVTSTYMPQQIPVMPIYNHQILNNPQQMQAIPPLIQTHPQNIIIRGEYPNYIQTNPLQVQHMPVYRMAIPAQPPQHQHHQQLSQPQHQQPITVYQIQPQVQQQQQHYNQIIHQQQQQQQQQLIQQHQPRHLNHYSSGNHYNGNNGGG